MSEVVTALTFFGRTAFSFMGTTIVPYLTVWQDLLL